MRLPTNGRTTQHHSHAPTATPAGRSTVLLGVGLALAALVPLVGWGARWPALASYFPGWPVVPPGAALALVAIGVGLACQRPELPTRIRRALAAACGWFALGITLYVRTGTGGARDVPDAAALVQGWAEAPSLALQYWPSRAAAVAIAILALSVALLALERLATLRAAWMLAAVAALLALASGGIPTPPALPEGSIQAALAAAEARAAVIPPAVAWLVLVGACAVLMRPADGPGSWIATHGPAGAVARRLLPAILLLVPGLIWLTDLAEHTRRLSMASAHALLALTQVSGLGAAVTLAVLHLNRLAELGRQREERRRHRIREKEVEQVARSAEDTLRMAADRYRGQLRAILEVAPDPFLALDGDGVVTYANAPALGEMGCSIEQAVGRPLRDLWPEVAEVTNAAGVAAIHGAPLHRTFTTPSGRRMELRGYPNEDGSAFFVRELAAR